MSSIKTKSYTQIRYLNTMAVAALLPFGGGILAIATAMLFVNWIIEGRFKYKLTSLQYPRLTITFMSVYLMHAAGMIYSTNTDFGINDLGIKLSMFILPVVFLMNRDFDPEKMRRILYAFIFGCLTAFVIGLVYGLATLEPNESLYRLSYTRLSVFIHPGYFSMYLSFAICIILFLLQKGHFRSKPELGGWILLTIILFGAQLLLASKMGILVSILVFLFTGGYYATTRSKALMGISIIVVVALFISLGINRFPYLHDRFQAFSGIADIEKIDKTSSESSAVRILVWKAALDIIKDNYLIGVGTGDVKDELLKKYKEMGMTGAYEHELNAHNQFIQFFITFGAVGLIVFITSLLVPLIYSFKKQKYLYAFFLIIFCIHLTTESVLEVQAGVIFYAFFNSLLLSTDRVFFWKVREQ